MAIPAFVKIGKNVFATNKIIGIVFHDRGVWVGFSGSVTYNADAHDSISISKEQGRELVRLLEAHVIKVEED